jgi:hypothetical protein
MDRPSSSNCPTARSGRSLFDYPERNRMTTPESTSRPTAAPAEAPSATNTLTLRAQAARRHLTRPHALGAMVLIATALGVVSAAGSSSAAGQGGLVVIGVLVTYVLLPETPHRLWNVDSLALSETIPAPQLLHASGALAEAIGLQARSAVPPEAVVAIWNADSRRARASH